MISQRWRMLRSKPIAFHGRSSKPDDLGPSSWPSFVLKPLVFVRVDFKLLNLVIVLFNNLRSYCGSLQSQGKQALSLCDPMGGWLESWTNLTVMARDQRQHGGQALLDRLMGNHSAVTASGFCCTAIVSLSALEAELRPHGGWLTGTSAVRGSGGCYTRFGQAIAILVLTSPSASSASMTLFLPSPWLVRDAHSHCKDSSAETKVVEWRVTLPANCRLQRFYAWTVFVDVWDECKQRISDLCVIGVKVESAKSGAVRRTFQQDLLANAANEANLNSKAKKAIVLSSSDANSVVENRTWCPWEKACVLRWRGKSEFQRTFPSLAELTADFGGIKSKSGVADFDVRSDGGDDIDDRYLPCAWHNERDRAVACNSKPVNAFAEMRCQMAQCEQRAVHSTRVL
ncbi:hypothetical protein KC350_g72 [Hortaea werneckii]|nr:hypothetical protein KC350_g72 [Hortaea werneckii]